MTASKKPYTITTIDLTKIRGRDNYIERLKARKTEWRLSSTSAGPWWAQKFATSGWMLKNEVREYPMPLTDVDASDEAIDSVGRFVAFLNEDHDRGGLIGEFLTKLERAVWR